MEYANVDNTKQGSVSFTDAYGDWLVSRGQLMKCASTGQDPSYDLGDEHFENLKQALIAPVQTIADLEDKIRMMLVDDAGDQFDQGIVDTLNLILRDLTNLRMHK